MLLFSFYVPAYTLAAELTKRETKIEKEKNRMLVEDIRQTQLG